MDDAHVPTDDRPWLDVPFEMLSFVALDVETTGMDPKRDRIVELAAVQVAPGEEPVVVLDTVLDPGQQVGGTEFHGIATWDVAGAPSFEHLAPLVAATIGDRLVVAHNAEFQLRIIGAEMSRVGQLMPVPGHICTLRLVRGMGTVKGHSLQAICDHLGVPYGTWHHARHDALAAARLLQRLFQGLAQMGVDTLRELGALATRSRRDSRLLETLEQPTWPASDVSPASVQLRPRRGVGSNYEGHLALRQYRDEVIGAVMDLDVTQEEQVRIVDLQQQLGLSPGQVRAIHARVFAAQISQFVDDDVLDADEAETLARLVSCLTALGWAPGLPVPSI